MEAELIRLSKTIKQAGARALELARSGFDVQTKRDRSPVTSADLEVNRILHAMQQGYFPDDGWLSEESPDDPARLDRSRVWIVDPIDGTNAYMKRLPDFCISVALVQDGKPVLAAIFNPSTDELFTAVRGQGLSLNGNRLVPSPSQDTTALVMVSPWEFRNGRWAGLENRLHCRPMLSIANAMALTAAGRIQAVLTIEPENEWDLAAGVLLIEESGGTVADAAGRPLTFNQPTPRFDGTIAVAATSDRLRPFLQAQADLARTKQAQS